MMLRIVLLLSLSSLTWGLAAGRVPYSLNVEWHLLRKSVGNISFTEIPRNTEKILLFNDSYDLGKAPAKSAAVFYNEFESERDGVMQIGMAADWWFECRLNGEAVYSTLAGGNREQQFSPENHVFNLPVKKRAKSAGGPRSGRGGRLAIFLWRGPIPENSPWGL